MNSALSNSSANPLKPGSTIGILGGGQLGRMLAIAAARLGLHTHIYCTTDNAPAFEVATNRTVAPFDDQPALLKFVEQCDVVTFEFENIPLATADLVTDSKPLFPPRQALKISQDRQVEKAFLAGLGLTVADWWPVQNADNLAKAVDECRSNALLKTRRLGYDGKGQVRIDTNTDLGKAFQRLGQQPAILERMITFSHEVSVVLVRNQQGHTRCYDIPRNEHADGILKSSTVPGRTDGEIEQLARQAAIKIADALNYVGVLAVEFFITDDPHNPSLIVNEFAPRVHNTGHWTLDACTCNQFENHIRAIAGWPLGKTDRHSDAKMTNLLGEDVLAWQELAAQADLAIHLYGKQGTQAGRKLGHKTQISPKI